MPIDAPASPTPSQNTTEPTSHGADSPDSAEAPAAFHFESGTLEIGDFDPYTLGDDIFDPCTEISPEEFAAAGFRNVEVFPEEYSGLLKGLQVCDVSKHNDVLSEAFGNNNANRENIEEQIPLLSQYKSFEVPEIYVFGPKHGMGAHCYAQIDTVRGGFVSQVTGLENNHGQDRACEIAVGNLESIFEANSS
ncbi:hypothetical protein ACUY2A_02220 [Corynebacterium pilbarense]